MESVYYQKALAHFAREYMEEGKVPWMTISQLVPESNMSKDLRIRGLEPLMSNHAVHCKKEHTEFIKEVTEYIPSNRLCKKDLLDTAAYQIQIARPGSPQPLDGRVRTPIDKMVVGNADDLLRHLWDKDKATDRFGNPTVIVNPFSESEETEMERLIVNASHLNPYEETSEDYWSWS